MTFKMWTIYEKPTDYPNDYVAREFVNGEPTQNIVISSDLEVIRKMMFEDFSMSVCFPRHPMDEPQIVETWM